MLVQRGPGCTLLDNVAVAAHGRTEPGTEIIAHGPGPVHTDIVRQLCVDAHDPGFKLTLRSRVEMHNLPGRVDTGVGATRADHLHAMVGHNRQRFLDFILNRARAMRLHLPAAKAAAVVFDAEGDSLGAGLVCCGHRDMFGLEQGLDSLFHASNLAAVQRQAA